MSHPSFMLVSQIAPMEDLTRFGLTLLSVPITVFAAGIVLGLIGRWVTARRDL